MSQFDERPILQYLQLPLDYSPSPTTSTIEFLTKHIKELPPHLLLHFSGILSAKTRTNIPVIRNRRLRFTLSKPAELEFDQARRAWPMLWSGRERPGQAEAADEKEWATRGFLLGQKKHVGNLPGLLADYEQEREAERIRALTREAARDEFVPEEDESDSDQDEPVAEDESENLQLEFEQLIHDKFIFGLLDEIDYDAVDWNDDLDIDDERDAQERWFDDDDEEME